MVRVVAVLLVAASIAGCSTDGKVLSAKISDTGPTPAAPNQTAPTSSKATTAAAAAPDCNPNAIYFLAFGLTGYMAAHAAKAADDPRCAQRDSEAQASIAAAREQPH